MKAALFTQYYGPLPLTDVSDPDCPRDGVIVKVMACGVCRSDHHAWSGQDEDVSPPHIAGHEFAGIVTEIGPDCHNFKLGARVTAPFILSCGTCSSCNAPSSTRNNDPTLCEDQHVMGFSAWGAFAQYVAVPFADFNLVKLPESLDFVTAAGMGCRVTTSFRALTHRAQLKPGEWVAVHGCGGIGLSAIMIAKALGARVIALDLNPKALDMAERLGADKTLNIRTLDNVGEAVKTQSNGGVHVSLEAIGVSTAFENSLRSLRKLGRHIQIGMPVGEHVSVNLPLLELIYSRQISLSGTRGMAARDFPSLFELIERQNCDFSQLITQTISLSQTYEALKAFDGLDNYGMTVIDKFDA